MILKRVFRDKVQSLTGFQVGTRAVPIDVISADGTLTHPELAELVGGEATTLHSHAHSEDNALAKAAKVTAGAATGIFTITTGVSDGEFVVIGEVTYEFDTDNNLANGLAIQVDVSAGATAAAAATALVTAMGEDPVVTASKGTGGIVELTSKTLGTASNSIATTSTCATGVFTTDTLEGGVNGTAGAVGEMAFDDSYLYICTAEVGSLYTWKKATLA